MKALGADFMPTVQRGLVSGTQRCVSILQRRTREAPPANPAGKGSGGAVNTGDYLRRWQSRAVPNGSQVYNNHPAAAVIEGGRRAGFWVSEQGLQALMAWARRRLGVEAKEALQAAFAIARAMYQRGLLPRNILAGGMAELIAAVDQDVMRELDAMLTRGK